MNPTDRRTFLKGAATGLAGASLATCDLLIPAVHAAGKETLKVGLIGCGGRGTGAATNAMAAGEDVRLHALGDMFKDALESSRSQLREEGKDRYAVDDDHCFIGFDAYKKVIDCCDVVLLATPPGFRPIHLKAAVEANKHCFVEKPVAVDGRGVREVMAACAEAKKKNLSIVSGLCWRYDNGMREIFQRIHGGDIGKIVALQCTYNVQDAKPPLKRDPSWSDMEYQIRNWYYFTWLSGDHNVEQHVHSLDKMAWAMKDEYPVKCAGLGGRQVRTAREYGNIFDHHSVIYDFADGTRCFSECRQQNGTRTEVSDQIMGTAGSAFPLGRDGRNYVIKGDKPWRYRGPKGNMYQNEHNEFFASIRAGKPINDGDWMSKSTLMGIMGRMATYTGQEITWDQALNSQENLVPTEFAFGPHEVPPVAVPGVTKLV